jgi:segregation and condensation protein A
MSETQATPPADGAAPGWQVRLPGFQGPLDVLLHLVRIDEVRIADIPILEVARQYDAYVEALLAPNLEAAGEYLVLAATLAHLKSRHLLPPDPSAGPLPAEAEADGEGRPPEVQGVRRAAEHLQEREAIMELVFSRPAERVAEYAGEQGIEADLSALLRAFREILRRVTADPAARVTRERITLVERINWLLETLGRDRRVGFRSLFAGLDDRASCILTFLALLELIRLRLVRAFESHHQEDLLIILTDQSPAGSPEEERADA